MAKRLYLSRDDRKLAGVCGGMAEYFDIDPTLVRLIALFLVIWGGSGILFYIVAAVVMKEPPYYQQGRGESENFYKEDAVDVNEYEEYDQKKNNSDFLLGGILIAIGGYFLLRNFFDWRWLSLSVLAPIGIVVVGFSILVNGRR